MESGCWIALDASEDVEADGPYWSAVQFVSLHEALPKISRRRFGVTLPIKSDELIAMLNLALPDAKFDSDLGDGKYVTQREFLEALAESGYAGPIPFTEPDLDLMLTRGDAARIIQYMW
jgi:hypothetical protein